MAKRPRREQSAPGELIPLEMVSVPQEGFHVLRFLDEYRGILTHWGKKRALACPGEDNCPSTTHRGRTIWKGYCAAEYWRDRPYEDWAPCVFEVTERLAELMTGHVLRGEVWKVLRQVGRNQTKEVFGECVDEVNADRLRKPFSVEPVVCRVFGTRDIAFDVEPYLPPRQFFVASAGDRPKGVANPVTREERPAVSPIRLGERFRHGQGGQSSGEREKGTERPATESPPPQTPATNGNGKH